MTGKLHTYLANLDEQAKEYCRLLIHQMAAAEGVTEDLKRLLQWEWIRSMSSIVNRVEEIVRHEPIFNNSQTILKRCKNNGLL